MEVLMLSVNLGKDDWGHADGLLEGSSLVLVLVLNLGEGGSELGRSNEGHDVRVVLEDEDLLGRGLIISGRSNSNNRSLSDVWEFQLKSKSVESLTGVVSELEFVGVLIKFENLLNLGNDIEVRFLLGSFLEVHNSVSSNVVGLEEVVGPFSEGLEDGGVLSLDGGSLSGEGVWGILRDGLSEWGLLISGEKSI